MIKYILIALIFTCLILLTACNQKTQYYSEDFISGINVDEELQNIEEMYDALSDFAESMGINLQLPDISNYKEELPPVDITAGFNPFPSKILLEDGTPGRTSLTGKVFFLNGFAAENVGWDGATVIDVLVLEEFTEGWATILIHVPDENEDWDNETGFNEQYVFFFQYLGFSEQYNRYMGIYIKHEPLDW